MGLTLMDISSTSPGPIENKWVFTEEQLRRTPSIVAGLSFSEEQQLIRHGCTFIRRLADRLNDAQRDSPKISHLCISVAMIQLRRFYTIQSLDQFDARDVGTASLFLSSKSEECPRRLEYFIRAWLKIRQEFDSKTNSTEKLIMNKEAYKVFAEYITNLENTLLQTIAFNITIEVPHVFVLKAAHNHDQRFKEACFWFTTDVLHLTNWYLRYSPDTIACACYYMVMLWTNELQNSKTNGNSWISSIDATISHEKLLEMVKEFLIIWKEIDKDFHLALSQFDHKVVPTILSQIPTNRTHS